MDKGTLVEFRPSGEGGAGATRPRRLAVVDRPEGKKLWVVIDERGQAHTLHPRDITYTVANQTYKPSEISAFLKEVQPYLDPDSLEVAWELLMEDGETVDPAGMARLLFSDDSPPLQYAAHCLLSDDRLYFKQKGDHYEPRPAAQVKELKHQLSVTLQRQQEWKGFLARLRQVLAGESLEWAAGDRPWLEALERFATLGEEASHRTPALEVLSALGRPETPEEAFQLLVDLRLWHPHENLFLRRSQIPIQFPSRVLEVAQRCLIDPPADSSRDRLDLTHLKVYTIDDESTREIDDGLSVEFLPDGQHRIWVHIADPSRWLTPGDALDLEARRRCITLYLPTGMTPMFPPELATGPMSLVQGQLCHAFSFGVLVAADGAIQSYEMHPTLIKPTYRLTYDDVDEMLQLGIQAEPELEILFQTASQRQRWRMQQGAISIQMPESSIKVTEDDEIRIDVFEESASRILVSEMMILAGEVAGRYGEAHGLPLPFRGQEQPELPPEEELMLLPPGPVRGCAVRRCMKRSEMGVTPIRHAGLGLEVYVQVTSPIRRYADLLAHFQIKAHLQGDPLPFSPEEMTELLQGIGSTTYEMVQVERQTNRYWSLEYLRRNANEVWPALVLRWLREHENFGLVLLEDLGLEMAMRFSRTVEVGDRLDVKVSYVDPRRDLIQFVEIDQAVPQAAS
ncbi:ribonuclease catalytic domain-containing protein [Thermoleptolyngbya sp. M55_K2018_002]|uniref:ribonuclease catalytic domain-containing protein n=1 Tax=Thermoleptolyngbya sp. M55_K2018_002 TaxID=2747808 RepID=UPI0019FA2DD5|nr:ribonuclease R family protein [Thermoleptolyngbya sp. M55_K2018_002]HIK42746.1 VacB/RNase II family 3'-5' exoribonuclease [Thermoleptolyngbya sp. M55_K2018_002]